MKIEKQLKIIKRGAVEIISEEELVKKLEESQRKKRPLRIKAGFDPTAPDIHLGHTVLLRKLRQFQDLGHIVYFLVGDFTARIGDPSGQNKTRKILTPKEIKNNAATYKKQAFKILDPKKIEVVFNSKWFDKMQGLEFGRLLTHYTVTRLLERDDFSSRMKEKRPLYMSELLYPILQGYDSVVLNADAEVGGTDQKFNMIVGRDLQRDFNQEPQVIITLPLLEGTDGINKMSKSLDNYIGITEKPQEMFGKIMSISDELMMKYYTLLTDEDLDKVKQMHPKEAKLRLARIITTQHHSDKIAEAAQEEFQRIFSARQLPKDMPVFQLKGSRRIIEIITESGLAKSGNEARRLIRQGAVNFENQKISDENFTVESSGILRVGSRRFLNIKKQW
jgi:tyrosyl-tRNA synthetase